MLSGEKIKIPGELVSHGCYIIKKEKHSASGPRAQDVFGFFFVSVSSSPSKKK